MCFPERKQSNHVALIVPVEKNISSQPTDENRAMRKAEAENLSSDGAIWITLPWNPSCSGYTGLKVPP